MAYLKAIWQALLLGLVLGAGIEALLPRMMLGRLFAGSMGSIRAGAFAIPSMMCTCCSAPIAVGMLESGAGATSALVYWLANPVLNPAALVFIGFVLGWQWAALRLAVGVALVFIVADLAARFVSPDWRPAGALSQLPDANRHFLLAWSSAFIRLAARLIPEYALLVFALGMVRAWFFPAMTPDIGHALWLTPALAAAGTLFVIPTAGEVPIIQVLQQFGLRRGRCRCIAHYLADGQPAIAHNVGAGAAVARDCRARLGDVRLRPARCRGGGSSGNVLTTPCHPTAKVLIVARALSIRSLQRLEVTQHGRNKLRHGGMNVHRALQHRVGRFGIHNVEDAVDGLVTCES
jgi:uncharacterized membrane protein YraQ (UPF0718 family)